MMMIAMMNRKKLFIRQLQHEKLISLLFFGEQEEREKKDTNKIYCLLIIAL